MEKVFGSWLLLIMFITANMIFNEKNIDNIFYVSVMLVFLLIFYLIMVDEKLIEWMNRLFLFFSSIHVVFILLQSFFPLYVMRINEIILPANSYMVNYSQVSRGMFAGITGQVGAAAFYVTIVIAFLSIKLLNNNTFKNRFFYSLGLFLSYYALLLTTKRALLMFNIIIFIVLLIFKLIINKSYLEKVIFWAVSLTIFSISILIFIESFSLFTGSNRYEDFSSGRISLYSETLKIASDNILMGIGFGNIELIMGEKTHNIYLQFLAEVGVLGIGLLLMSLSIPFFTVLKKIIFISNNSFSGSDSFKYRLYLSFYMQLVFIFYGLLGNPLYDYFMFGIYLFFVVLGINTKYEIEKENEYEKNWGTYIS
ncbi:O-antigen ligase [Exiguobacterium sp. SH3S1]|uniref:O-antigen ligase family protein n=1 Tax=Exiguobacterium sp. SH3S1 TaxID=2510955 RepID=UPI001375BE28|nr:O-antigen ligase family protein [Exiguobacterium sp. SH3S1]